MCSFQSANLICEKEFFGGYWHVDIARETYIAWEIDSGDKNSVLILVLKKNELRRQLFVFSYKTSVKGPIYKNACDLIERSAGVFFSSPLISINVTLSHCLTRNVCADQCRHQIYNLIRGFFFNKLFKIHLSSAHKKLWEKTNYWQESENEAKKSNERKIAQNEKKSDKHNIPLWTENIYQQLTFPVTVFLNSCHGHWKKAADILQRQDGPVKNWINCARSINHEAKKIKQQESKKKPFVSIDESK